MKWVYAEIGKTKSNSVEAESLKEATEKIYAKEGNKDFAYAERDDAGGKRENWYKKLRKKWLNNGPY